MKKSLFVALVCAALVGAFVLPNLYAVDVPDDMLLKAPAGVKMKKAPVPFSHKGAHKGIECTKCHHTWDGKSPIKKCTDAGCHDIAKAKGKDRKSIKYFYTAYHKLCMKGCHKELKKAGKKTGPTSCNGCHPKKK